MIEKNFRDFIGSIPNGTNVFRSLPQKVRYYPLIADCYNRIFYGRSKKPQNCPGPLRCQLPTIPGLNCALAKREFLHNHINSMVEVHYSSREGEFIISNNGCNM